MEQLIREARAAGYDGSQANLSRLVRGYVNARTDWTFARWLGYHDPTGETAVRNVLQGTSR